MPWSLSTKSNIRTMSLSYRGTASMTYMSFLILKKHTTFSHHITIWFGS